MWTVSVLSLGAAVAVSLSVELLCRFLHRSKRSRTLNEVLFFPSKVACMEHVFSPASPHSSHCPLPHGVETSFSRLLRFILSASSSLDLCMFSFSNMDLCRAVLELHRRRVTVRILVDKHYSVITGSQIGALRNAGICVHNVGRYVHMHHKFAVVDNRLLITGSLNWTLAAVQSNSENIIITEEPALVRPFMREFSRLWADNDPSQNAPLTGQTLDCID
ncbi:mitochondrial cardiolipin hydrolase isoform X1 [Nerophis lumbriciformis]|uniref:mitochondrial cardiolipin hydrolase isoform X1 n=1 Tax=Nerophis lumbriciformis TaxID=546530 RepID=UPI002ADF28D8|nr:mitochondrial cardiolipin hydrolase-like isoform X1 [Nerophis lumbriciformis]XP_061839754.1 mitochondrial cardiolipin hydrolase-like isoform X1 [Nerophis lumbriciformis]XP_061839755.1 mitochondrial cardiolipin hydrolase-like isoform X1 [Nerophis lumbriciformis]XP_061839757.1 mitochondrial cardiolipin hydrolase-like isoform X1 [Nerophis lumbriciformis]XP_061839758.1 mitochondrial cardiolipin hydrolase-like isoform X1 [Nerophis lumbriciformis]XP_061839759.1 mitochondrial cardiolipin hydrolase